MLLAPAPATTRRNIPPGFIDFASSSFDAILHQRHKVQTGPGQAEEEKDYEKYPPVIQRRASHLPDLLPFIEMITEKCNVQPVHLVMALIYVQRFRESLPEGYKPESEAAHRIFAASLLLASKYSDDYYLSTKHLVRATGDVWSIKEMTRMELALMSFLKWNLHIDREEITAFLRNLHFDVQSILPDNLPDYV
ncbi:hypothetical protein VTP01DRAFT_3574 [Rhizomucor pusillus]|uniref:uncharacterized protein n=1 Tax=Rhizomucor pusillus TaxID=4840 RepID=UPI0037422EC8